MRDLKTYIHKLAQKTTSFYDCQRAAGARPTFDIWSIGCWQHATTLRTGSRLTKNIIWAIEDELDSQSGKASATTSCYRNARKGQCSLRVKARDIARSGGAGRMHSSSFRLNARGKLRWCSCTVMTDPAPFERFLPSFRLTHGFTITHLHQTLKCREALHKQAFTERRFVGINKLQFQNISFTFIWPPWRFQDVSVKLKPKHLSII